MSTVSKGQKNETWKIGLHAHFSGPEAVSGGSF